MNTITADELKDRLDTNGAVLIDVRTPAEFQEVHVVGAVNIPLDRLSEQSISSVATEDHGATVYFICKSGSRGRMACEKLKTSALPVVNVEGGTEACVDAGLTVRRGRKAISLERQVRIVAGLLVLIGAVLALVVSKWFALLPAFIGAGLVFAGITDTCGMGMLLARMPWNQVRCDSATCSSHKNSRLFESTINGADGRPIPAKSEKLCEPT